MKIILSILLFFLTGCNLSKASNYTMTVNSLSDYWSIKPGHYSTGKVFAIPRNELSKINNTVISIDVTEALIALDSPNCKQNTISLGYNKVILSFMKLSNHNFTFRNNDFKIVKGSKEYTLQPINEKNSSNHINVSPQKNVRGEIYWPNRYHNFILPLFCNDLNNTIFIVSGIYENGKELPPIKFRINLLNQAGIKS